jgi:hypothetical protein
MSLSGNDAALDDKASPRLRLTQYRPTEGLCFLAEGFWLPADVAFDEFAP